MKCIIFCLVLAVAAAAPADDDQDSRRRLQALQLTVLNDADHNKNSPNVGSENVNRQSQNSQYVYGHNDKDNSDRYNSQYAYNRNDKNSDRYYNSQYAYNRNDKNSDRYYNSQYAYGSNDKENSDRYYNSPYYGTETVIGGHDRDDDSYLDNSQKSQGQNLDELASVLDYLTKRYQGRGVLKVAYNPVTKSSKNPRVYKLGALRFTYIAPQDYNKLDESRSNDRSGKSILNKKQSKISNLKGPQPPYVVNKHPNPNFKKPKSDKHNMGFLPQFNSKDKHLTKFQHLILNSQKTQPSNRYPSRQFLRFDDDRDSSDRRDDDRRDDDRQDDDRQDDDRQDDDRQDDDRQDDDRQDDDRQDDDRQDDDRQDDDRQDDDRQDDDRQDDDSQDDDRRDDDRDDDDQDK